MRYNKIKTQLFAQACSTTTIDFPTLIIDEGGQSDLNSCTHLNVQTECISGDLYASQHPEVGQIPKSGDSLFAIDCGLDFRVVIAEMKFKCQSNKQDEALASDIKQKTNRTKQLFNIGYTFHQNVYVLLSQKQQMLLNRLQKRLGSQSIYKVTTLKDFENIFFV